MLFGLKAIAQSFSSDGSEIQTSTSQRHYLEATTNPSTSVEMINVFGRMVPFEVIDSAILTCESKNQHFNDDGTVKCNGQFGCKGGIGAYQELESTGTYCSVGMSRPINPYVEEENRACGQWLLRQDGPRHWGYPPDDPRGYINGFYWGSYLCWIKLI